MHPDKCDDGRAEDAFHHVQEAQETLLDGVSRTALDEQLQTRVGQEEAEAPAEHNGWWGAPGDSDAELWLVHDASVIPSSGPSVSLRLFNGTPDPASKWTDEELRTHLHDQAAETKRAVATGGNRLVWVYVFNNERHFAHGWALY